MTIQPTQSRPREEFVAAGTLVNTGAEPVVLDLAPLSSPSLALEIVDAHGAPVRLPPPPVPGREVRTVQLAPGQGHTVQFAGFVPQWVPSGTFRARLRYVCRPRVVVSDWSEFRILE